MDLNNNFKGNIRIFKAIFQLGKIGNLEIKNRLVVPVMLTEFAAEDGSLTERYIRYYEEKARGGWGLIICEDNVIDPLGAGFKCIPGIDKPLVHTTEAVLKGQLDLAGKIKDQFPTTVIGDALTVGKALEGINTAFALALKL